MEEHEGNLLQPKPDIISVERKRMGGAYNWTEMASVLPRGVALLKRRESDPSPVGRVFIECLGRAIADEGLLEAVPAEQKTLAIRELSVGRRIGPGLVLPGLIAMAGRNLVIDAAIKQLLTSYPNLCWMRGGEYMAKNRPAQVLSAFPRNGLIGDVKVIRWAYEGYGRMLRENPALYVARMADILEAVADGVISVFSEHGSDLCIKPHSDDQYEGAIKWVDKNVAAFRLPIGDEDKGKAQELLLSKCIHPDILE